MIFDYKLNQSKYNELQVFETLNVNIQVGLTNYDKDRFYIIKNIDVAGGPFNSSVLKNIGESITENVNHLEFKASHSKIRKSWSAFYTLKEIVDIIRNLNPKGYKLYFRGQAGDWELQPTLYRDGENGYSDDFRERFDSIYESVANKFPNEIKYIPEIGNEERASNLAILQHYGLGTPLLDITENPFIAMLFMVNNYSYNDEHSSPKLDIFFKNEKGDNILFQEVRNSNHNLRLTVQKGAFLNYERLNNNDDDLISANFKLDRISINLQYTDADTSKYEYDMLPDGVIGSEADDAPEVVLTTAIKDIESKLESFNYISNDLFPDFYKHLEMIKGKYSDRDQSNNDDPWYKYKKVIF